MIFTHTRRCLTAISTSAKPVRSGMWPRDITPRKAESVCESMNRNGSKTHHGKLNYLNTNEKAGPTAPASGVLEQLSEMPSATEDLPANRAKCVVKRRKHITTIIADPWWFDGFVSSIIGSTVTDRK